MANDLPITSDVAAAYCLCKRKAFSFYGVSKAGIPINTSC